MGSLAILITKLEILLMLHFPSAFLLRMYNWFVLDTCNPVVLTATAKLLMSIAGVMVIGVPFPIPGSVLIKYSAAIIFCGATGGV